MPEELPPPARSGQLSRQRRLVMHHSGRNEAPHSITADANPPSDSPNHLQQDDSQDHKEPTTVQHHRVKGSSHALFLRAKYNGIFENGYHNDISAQNGHVHDHEKHMEHHPNGIVITRPHQDEQRKDSHSRLPLRAKYNHPSTDHHAIDYHEHERHVEHDADIDHLSHQKATRAEHHSKRGGRIAASTLQEARAQAAELRALHSAVVNSHNISLIGMDVQNVMASQHAMPMMHYKSRTNNKESKIHNHISGVKEVQEDVHGALSSASSASSTADCFIRPLHEYPVFTPHSQEDVLLNTSVEDMNRRSSADTYEAAMLREDRFQYIFGHANKRSFSGTHCDDRYIQEPSISCLHESLNLPPRSAMMQLRDNEDRQLHHMSLNLPQGSQRHLFKSSMPNPLFDPQSMHIHKKSFHHLDDGSACSPSSKTTYNDDLPGKPLKGNKGEKYVDARETALQDFTSREKALIEFLSEEPARMRAFNELASKEAIPNREVHPSMAGMTIPKQKIIQQDVAIPSSMKLHMNKESPSWNVDQKEISSSHHHHPQQDHHEPAISSIQQQRHRLAHTLNNNHLKQPSSVSCDKCRPAGTTFPSVVFPRTDSSGARSINSPSNAVGALIKDRPDQLKRTSIRGWFFRGKKKQNNADHSNNPAYPASDPSVSTNRTPATSGTFSVSKEQQSIASTTAPTSAPTSNVFSGLATSETEKELEMAMAMDLMELKVLQANTKRDAAMAEALELRLAMDSMANKLVEIERHCESLKSQLLDVQKSRETESGVDRNAVIPASGRFDNGAVDPWMHPPTADDDGDESGVAADRGHGGVTGALADVEDDFCESDSHDNREERKAAASKIRAGLNMQSYGYGRKRSSSGRRSMAQPKKEEFLSAVAEARVGVKQVSRVLLQHVQESTGRGVLVEMEGEVEGGAGAEQQWRPILMMCREASRAEEKAPGSSSRSREVGYCIEALINLAFYEHFENVGFDKSGAHHILDPSQRALTFYHSFLKLAKLTPTQLLTQSSAVYNPAFDRFCSRKMRALGRAVGCPSRLWPDELAHIFLSAARAVWLLHQLAFAFPAWEPAIFRVAAHSPFDPRFMELLPTHQRYVALPHRLVSLMVIPGFFLWDDVIKCKVLA